MQKVVIKNSKLEQNNNVNKLLKLPNLSSYVTVIIVALVIALIVSIFLWTRSSSYGVLYNRLSDEDEGSIITKLSQMNIPYRLNEKSGTILVPDDIIYELRLNLAKDGFPKGSGIGFELLDKQGFGISQFNEQINYQRALEGELSKTIQKIDVIKYARVHLGSFPSAFFLDKKKEPSVGIILELHKGRTLNFGQVQSIVHLVSSSIADLKVSNITIIDQYGRLLSQSGREFDQIHNFYYKYCNELEQSYSRKIEELLFPMFGPDNIHAQVTAELDFNAKDYIEERYDPNFLSKAQSIRSRQQSSNKEPFQTTNSFKYLASKPKHFKNISKDISNKTMQKFKGKNFLKKETVGILNDTKNNNKKQPYGYEHRNFSTHSEDTVNYELNRTLLHTKLNKGAIKRLSIAVVVNYLKNINKKLVPLSVLQLNQVKNLTKAAIGYSEKRGDTLVVANLLFFKPKLNETKIIDSTNNILISHTLLQGIFFIFLVILIIFVLSYLILIKINNKKVNKKLQSYNKQSNNNQNYLKQNENDSKEVHQSFNNDYSIYNNQNNSMQDIKEIRESDSQIIAKIIRYWIHENL